MKYTVLLTAPYMLPFLERFKPEFRKYDLDLIVPDVEERILICLALANTLLFSANILAVLCPLPTAIRMVVPVAG